ncbi:MAG: MFS transporter [Caulobacter sp.]|nr:MFS transporter [Caulobacter sp.]
MALSTHRRWRLTALFLLYAAQGAPEGLLYIAVPAWLVAQGATAAEIGSYIAIILLPWSLKFINGLLMDRFAFPAMGRRRPWLLAAQFALVLTLVAISLQGPSANLVVTMTIIGFCVNLAGAFQDVAIDGMAIDIVPEHERARANGVMWGGKTLGISGGAIVTGMLISHLGLAAAALASAAFVSLVFLFPLFLRERPGERLFPWSRGDASVEAGPRPASRFKDIARALLTVLIRPQSLLFALGLFLAMISYGLHTAFGPVMAVKRLAWTTEAYSTLAGAANLVGGLFGLVLSGFIADRLGPTRTVVIAVGGMAALQAALAVVPGYWSAQGVFAGFILLHSVLFVLLSVALYASAMGLCQPLVAATQFSIYMAILNLGTSAGAHNFGGVLDRLDYGGVLLTGAAFCAASMLVFLVVESRSRAAAAAPAGRP